MDFVESDCCGNGCSNCILNTPPTKTPLDSNFDNKINCLLQYRNYKLTEKTIVCSPDIIKLEFQLENNEANLTIFIPPGHHVMMKISNCRRPYSPFLVDRVKLKFEILVNLKPNGEMSQYIKQLSKGDLVEFIGPIGSFLHKSTGPYENLIIFTHGVAVAPVIPIIREILNNEDDMTRIRVVGCFNNLNNYYFREQFHSFKQFWNFYSQIHLSRQTCEHFCTTDLEKCTHWRQKLKFNEKIIPKRLTTNDIDIFVNILNVNKSRFIICGSKEFEKFIRTSLNSLAVHEDLIIVL